MPQKHNPVFRFLASLKVAVSLLIVLGVVLATATVLESKFGREWAQWYCYTSGWFIGLIAALCLNIASAMLIRFPWKKPMIVFVLLQTVLMVLMYFSYTSWFAGSAMTLWPILSCLIVLSLLVLMATLIVAPSQRHQIGFLVTHAGVLALMAGALQTSLLGIEGRLAFAEGDQENMIVLNDRCQLTVSKQGAAGGMEEVAKASFRPGPVNWPESKVIDFGQIDGLGIRVVKFYPRAERASAWIEDESGQGPAALRLALLGPDGKSVDEQWLSLNQPGGAIALAQMAVSLLPAASEAMLEDFLHPPKLEKNPTGILSIHYEGEMHRIDVGESLGKKVAVGESGIEVEIVEYLPDAKGSGNGRFVSASNMPRNPLLELLVYLPGATTPAREIAIAKVPSLSLDGVLRRVLPVKFWYHHPSVMAGAGVEFMQTPDGKLFGRVAVEDSKRSLDEVKQGDQVELDAGFKLSLLEYLPHAHEEIGFKPVADETQGAEAAALVEVSADDTVQHVWLRRGDRQFGFRWVETSNGAHQLALGYEDYHLGYSLKLHDFVREENPGRMGNASFASTVQLIDTSKTIRPEDIDERHEISMNHPLTHGIFTFYQSSYNEVGGREASILSVAYDPGRFLKYLGSIVICVGMFVMFYIRSRAPRKMSAKTAAAIVAFLALSVPTSASAAGDFLVELDWSAWQRLPVQDGGRHKPLDTLARESLATYCDNTDATDLQVGRSLRPTALYMAMLFDWQGWQQASHSHAMGGTNYFQGHEPDDWDRAKTIRVNSAELRKALRLDGSREYFSLLELVNSNVRDPETGRDIPLGTWTRMMPRSREQLSELETAAQELSNKVWQHQSHRMGQRLEIVPVADSEHKEWMSIADLMQAKPDDQTDPGGELRDLRQKFETVRAAYLKQSPSAFNKASAEFIKAAGKLGPKLGSYPTQSTVNLEVTYNCWPPYTFAWVFVLASFFFASLRVVTSAKPLGVVAIACSVGCLLCMLIGFSMRGIITGWIPVINMYDSVIFMCLGTVVFGLFFELRARNGFIMAATAAVAAASLILADYCPSVLDPSLRLPPPVLRSNFWLAIHVMSIMASYSAFALALGIGNITLGYYLVGSAKRDLINGLCGFIYKLLQAGLLLLAIGTILGGFWADYSWGRFWSWDPKECWALITLLFYMAVVHARYVGWCGNRGMAAWSVVCFSVLVVMAWYGVNFVLGSGMHSYGSGGGGVYWVAGTVSLQCLYVLLAVLISASRDAMSVPAKGKAS